MLVINRVNASNESTPAAREYIEYSGTSGTTVLITTRNVDSSNSALTHAVGSIVEFIPDVTWADRIYDALANVVDVDTLAVDTTKVVTPASVTSSSIVLSGSNYFSASGATISTIKDEDDMTSNSATALATQQSIKAYVDTGTVTMTNKTLTSPVLQGDVSGWTVSTDTWTYASASTFTIAGVDRTAVYTKGTRLKFTQTTVKYAVVVSSSFSTNTTVTIAVNTDYTIANAAITLPYYSYQASPQGYPGWFAYTPTPNNLTVGSGTLTGRFSLTGTTASFYINFVFSSTGSAVGTAPTVTLPISALNVGVYYSSIEDYGTTRFGAYITRVDATTIQINCWSAAASYLTYALVASGVPMTWANNDSFVISGQYEIA